MEENKKNVKDASNFVIDKFLPASEPVKEVVKAVSGHVVDSAMKW